MARILFVDDRPNEIKRQWQLSGCEQDHELLPFEVFESIEQIGQMVEIMQPDVIAIGYGLGKPAITGIDVIRSLRDQGYNGFVIANSGGGAEPFIQAGVKINASANRNPHELKRAMKMIFPEGGKNASKNFEKQKRKNRRAIRKVA